MPQPISSRLEDRSRIARVLSAFAEQNLLTPESNLAERLGHLVGVAGSMNLARGLRLLPEQAAVGPALSIEQTQSILMEGRAQILSRIVQSFADDHGGESQNTLPSIASGLRVEALKSFEPYQRFYTAHQIELAVAIKQLRQRLREALASTSANMHRLAVLDHVVDESLEAHTRKLFNVLPKVLEKRFKRCRDRFSELSTWDGTNKDWLQPFYQDMRELLLAEFDIRFQPLLGLLEALQEHTDITYE